MAKIIEQLVVLKLSKLVKDSTEQHQLIESDTIAQLELVVQQLVETDTVVEVMVE